MLTNSLITLLTTPSSLDFSSKNVTVSKKNKPDMVNLQYDETTCYNESSTGVNMPKLKFEWIDREMFCEERYLRYEMNVLTKEALGDIGEKILLTNLDSYDETFEAQLRFVVICDRCNDNIPDHKFVMLEGQNCYHPKCVQDEHWFKPYKTTETLNKKNVLIFSPRT